MATKKTTETKKSSVSNKQKAVVENTDVVKHEVAEEKMTRVEFIIPVYSTEKGIIYERGKQYFLTKKEIMKYKGDYRIC